MPDVIILYCIRSRCVHDGKNLESRCHETKVMDPFASATARYPTTVRIIVRWSASTVDTIRTRMIDVKDIFVRFRMS